jgi:hypothetical protein
MTWKLYAAVSAGAFVATYLMSTPPATHERVAPATPQGTPRRTSDAAEIEQLAARLARVRAETNYRQPGRDLFRFGPAPSAASPVAAPTVVEPSAPPPVLPVLPSVTLSGIAVDRLNEGVQRSAVLSTPAGVLIVREGESVAGLYRVVSIADDSVELELIGDGSQRTLRFSR